MLPSAVPPYLPVSFTTAVFYLFSLNPCPVTALTEIYPSLSEQASVTSFNYKHRIICFASYPLDDCIRQWSHRQREQIQTDFRGQRQR